MVGYNRFPDEKGTESSTLDRPVIAFTRYNRFPDEKGTESTNACGFGSVSLGRYNRFPDEKGTESVTLERGECCLLLVTTVSPMKRGLKAHSLILTKALQTLQPFPR